MTTNIGMEKIKAKLEQIHQSIDLYKKRLQKTGDLSSEDNKKLLDAVQLLEEKEARLSLFFGNETAVSLIGAYKKIKTTYAELPITEMKGLDSIAMQQLPNLIRFEATITGWMTTYEGLEAKL